MGRLYTPLVLLVTASALWVKSAAAGTTFHVRVDGNDAVCTGKSDAPAGAAPGCAFSTLQKAADTILPGDDVLIHAGKYASFTLRGLAQGGLFQASSADPTVIEGDPSLDRSQIVVEGGASSAAFYSAGGTSTSTRTKFVVLRHLRVTGGVDAAVYLDNEHDDIVVQDLLIDGLEKLGGSIDGKINGGRHAPAPRDAALIVNWASKITLEDLEIIGGPYYCAAPQGGGKLCGVDASAISLSATNSTVRRVEASDFLGNFLLRAPSNGVVEHNIVRNHGCDSDDGCVQLYNTANVTIRNNLFVGCTSLNESLAVIRMRRSSASTQEPSAQIHNNTFIGNTTAGFIANHTKKAVEIAPPGSASSYGPTSIKNNIFIGNYGDADGPAGAVTINHCPTPLDADHNLYFSNIKDFANVAGCAGSFETHAVFADPQLDATHAPSAGSPACGAGENGVDIGALSCAGAAGAGGQGGAAGNGGSSGGSSGASLGGASAGAAQGGGSPGAGGAAATSSGGSNASDGGNASSAGDDSGCGCRSASRGEPARGWVGLCLLVLLGLRRTRGALLQRRLTLRALKPRKA